VIAVAAANASLDALNTPGMYEGLYARCDQLMEGLRDIFGRTNLPAHMVGMGPILQVWFSNKPIHNYRDAARYCDHDMFRRWWEGCLNRGVLFHPGAYENLFVSFAHTEADIEATLAVAREVVKEI
jgi:glutamate-1-semialdehyde 2,1-aminomutase